MRQQHLTKGLSVWIQRLDDLNNASPGGDGEEEGALVLLSCLDTQVAMFSTWEPSEEIPFTFHTKRHPRPRRNHYATSWHLAVFPTMCLGGRGRRLHWESSILLLTRMVVLMRDEAIMCACLYDRVLWAGRWWEKGGKLHLPGPKLLSRFAQALGQLPPLSLASTEFCLVKAALVTARGKSLGMLSSKVCCRLLHCEQAELPFSGPLGKHCADTQCGEMGRKGNSGVHRSKDGPSHVSVNLLLKHELTAKKNTRTSINPGALRCTNFKESKKVALLVLES